MKVGGRNFDMTKEQVEAKMRGEVPELIQKHVVELSGTVFPPKQVLGHVTGWGRTTFTTMEAQRVLRKLGFVCREAGVDSEGTPAWLMTADDPTTEPDDALVALGARLALAEERIAGLVARVQVLEARS